MGTDTRDHAGMRAAQLERARAISKLKGRTYYFLAREIARWAEETPEWRAKLRPAMVRRIRDATRRGVLLGAWATGAEYAAKRAGER